MPNILLTGSSRGIGAAIAATLAARDDVRLIGHGTTSGIAADFADPAAPQTLWNAALDALGGRIDVLINNAGVFEDAPLDQPHAAWVATWERTIRINLTASAELCRLAERHWQDQDSTGRIVKHPNRAAYRGSTPSHQPYTPPNKRQSGARD